MLYSTKWVKYARTTQHTQHTTHNTQHTTTNISRCRPTLQRLWPFPSMGRPVAPLTHGAATPYGPIQGTHHRVRWRRCWFPCLGRRNATHQKTERGAGVSALGVCHLIGKTQQPTKSWRLLWGGYWGGHTTAVERVGESFAIVWGRPIR